MLVRLHVDVLTIAKAAGCAVVPLYDWRGRVVAYELVPISGDEKKEEERHHG